MLLLPKVALAGTSTKLKMVAANAAGMASTPLEIAILHAVGPSGLVPFAAPFEPPAAYDLGGNAYSLAADDFNADGKLDVAVATPNGIEVLIGDGQGGFQESHSYAAAGSLFHLNAVDINHDLAVDLLVSVGGASNIFVFLGELDQGKPTGMFAAPMSITVGANPREILAAHFNGDAHVDLAVALYGANQVAVLLGNGSGSFAAPVSYAAGSMPIGLATADFDEDGALDLAAAHYGAGTDGYAVAVLFGLKTGDLPNGQFSALTDIPVTGSNPQDVAAGGRPKRRRLGQRSERARVSAQRRLAARGLGGE